MRRAWRWTGEKEAEGREKRNEASSRCWFEPNPRLAHPPCSDRRPTARNRPSPYSQSEARSNPTPALPAPHHGLARRQPRRPCSNLHPRSSKEEDGQAQASSQAGTFIGARPPSPQPLTPSLSPGRSWPSELPCAIPVLNVLTRHPQIEKKAPEQTGQTFNVWYGKWVSG